MPIKELQNKHSLIFQLRTFPCGKLANNKPIGFVTRTDMVRYLSEQSASVAEEFEAVLNSVSNGVMAINSVGIVTIFNPAAQAITGMKADNVVGRPAIDMMPNDTGLMSVLETGTTQMNQKTIFGNSQIITKRSPIVKNNKIVGGSGYFSGRYRVAKNGIGT